jgi:hypothetical protein
MKIDDFFMLLAKIMGVALIIVLLYALGVFDSMLGREKMHRDYWNKYQNNYHEAQRRNN